MDYVIYKVFAGGGKLLALLPMRMLYVVSDLLYPLVYYIVRYRRKVVYENLHNSFPEKSDKEIQQIAKKFYRYFCDMLLETVKLFHIKPEELISRLKFKDKSQILEEYERKKHILVVLGHYGNWEWGLSLGMQIPYNFVGIYKPLTNRYFDQLMIRLRTQFGSEAVPMKQTPRALATYIQQGRLTILNFIADQSPHSSEIQYWTNFLNQDTPVFLGIEKFAVKTRQPVYFFCINRIKRGYYEVDVKKLCDDASTLATHELTEMHVRLLEENIRKAPETWLWTHRRWKNKREQYKTT
jgi:KDO2-lipid IV(A) lauroyltransferase